MGLMIAFVIAQALWIARYVPQEPAGGEQPKDANAVRDPR
jgi:hypothetical protein